MVRRPPGPGPLAALTFRRDPIASFERIARENPRIAHAHFGREHIYVLSDPAVVREIYVSNGRNLKKGRTLERIKVLLGEGLLTSEGEHHRRQRRMIQPSFHSKQITAYTAPMVSTALEYDARWQLGAELDLAKEMSALTLSIVGQALFGTDVRSESDEVSRSLSMLMAGFQRYMLPGADLLLAVPTPRRQRLFAAVQRLDAVVRSLVAARRTRPPGDDLLWRLIEVRDDGHAMSDTQVRDEVMTLLLAGHETTATLLTWTWWLLDQHRAVASWLWEELDALPARALTYEDIERLPRTHAIVAESMRVRPPVWLLGRRATTDLEVDGWTIPAGSLCTASQWVLHRDARFWPAPLEFRPSRWLSSSGEFDESAPGQSRTTYFPFGLAARTCVGESFAWAEGVLVLATLARRWDPRLVPGHPVELQPAVTLRPRHGMRMTLHRR
ncbi:cytochrome P450 [Tenggerimyces flavus]|uniref:Cytochrome P450 n=1 Tax=Tenggerimyces flavus TaxID=1708749 RepID=A0ABV7Y8P0_9ACTN|nr:cytochrome P450 [Tenggerimyces flavus]MBM7791107.1 cytochrome P450 [Tenggerimyces flavus]